MLYQIKALNPLILFMCILGIFSGFHGNGSQNVIKKTEEKLSFFYFCVIVKCDLVYWQYGLKWVILSDQWQIMANVLSN